MTKIRSILVITAEVSSLLLIFGFLLSVIINQYIFDRWGLNFLQLATVNDVILGGLMFVTDFFEGIVPLSLGYMFVTRLRKQQVLFKKQEHEVIVDLPLIMIIVTTALWLTFSISSNPILSFMRSFSLYGGVGIFIGVYTIWLKQEEQVLFGRVLAAKASRRIRIASMILAIPFGLLLIGSLVPSRVGNTNGSYLIAGRPTFITAYDLFRYAANVDIPRCRRLAILWVGERAIVAACNEPTFADPSQIVVLANPEQVLITTRHLHPKGPVNGRTQYNCAWPEDKKMDSCKKK